MQSAIQNSRNDTHSKPYKVRLRLKTLEHMPSDPLQASYNYTEEPYLFITATKQKGSEIVMAILGEGTMIE